MNIDIKNIAYFPMIFFDAKLINQNEIIFDTKQTSPFNFLKLCRNLKIFPITSSNFLKELKKNSSILLTQVSKENLRINLKKKFSDRFEIFCIDQVIEDFPEIFLGYFNSSRKMLTKIVSDKRKIIFSNQDIFLNDIYKFG